MHFFTAEHVFHLLPQLQAVSLKHSLQDSEADQASLLQHEGVSEAQAEGLQQEAEDLIR